MVLVGIDSEHREAQRSVLEKRFMQWYRSGYWLLLIHQDFLDRPNQDIQFRTDRTSMRSGQHDLDASAVCAAHG